jgi:hypothetical protein
MGRGSARSSHGLRLSLVAILDECIESFQFTFVDVAEGEIIHLNGGLARRWAIVSGLYRVKLLESRVVKVIILEITIRAHRCRDLDEGGETGMHVIAHRSVT